jgi:hypothetical protein
LPSIVIVFAAGVTACALCVVVTASDGCTTPAAAHIATTTNEDVVILVTACSRSLLPAERLRERTARNLRSNRHAAMNIG